MTDAPAVEVRDLSAGYGGRAVIRDVNFEVCGDDYVGVIGPNGGGKSTLIRAILGLLRPMRGSVTLLGDAPERTRHRVGYVPQVGSFDRAFPVTVFDVVLMGRRARRGAAPWWAAADREAASRALDAVQMLPMKDEPAGELSGGQSQRMLVARALVGDPELLILDEPTASLDPDVQRGVYHLLAELNERVPIMLVTHDIGVISSHVRRVACLNQQLFSHEERKLTREMLEQTYHCPVDLIAHGVPHRVFEHHDHGDAGHTCDEGEGD